MAADATRPGSALAFFCAAFLPFAFAVPLADGPAGSEVPTGSETEGSGSGLGDAEEDARGTENPGHQR